MPRTEELRLTDFTGGLNLRGGEFYLAPDESPEMLNCFLDRRGGFRQRFGVERWNGPDIVTPANWDPRHMHVTPQADGTFEVFVATNNEVWVGDHLGVFSDTTVGGVASPHEADFASWGDDTYMALGRTVPSVRWDGTANVLVDPTASSGAGFNDDETAPVGGHMPKGELVVEHNGRLFVGNISEDGADMPNRFRWSHPLEPGDWRTDDYWDVDLGGGKITALVSQTDRLLIFKTNAIFALYGSGLDDFELQKVSSSLSTVSPASVTSSESAVIFFSRQGSRSGVFALSPDNVELLSTPIELALDQMQNEENVFVDYVDRFLHVSVEWGYDQPATTDALLFVHNGEVGNGGSWTVQQPARGSFRMSVQPPGYGVLTAVTDVTDESLIALLDVHDAAYDTLDESLTQERFTSSYSTGWVDADSPTRKKHWLRPKYLVRQPITATEIQVDVYWDYQSATVRRSFLVSVDPEGDLFWTALGSGDPDGTDWGSGEQWSGAGEGHQLDRIPTSLGVAQSVRLRFSSPENGTLVGRWLVDAIFLKYANRRHTT